MFFNDKKKVAQVVMSHLKDDGSKVDAHVIPEVETDPMSESKKAICEEMIGAFQKGSAHDLMVALDAYLSQSDKD